MKQFGLFKFGDHAYAVPMIGLQRVVNTPALYELPRTGVWYPRVLIDEGEVVPLFDLARWLQNITASAVGQYVVIYNSEFGRIGLPADLTCGIVSESSGGVIPVDEDEDLVGHQHVFAYNGDRYSILDVDVMIHSMHCG